MKTIGVLWAVLISATTLSVAYAQEDAQRDADIFGEQTDFNVEDDAENNHEESATAKRLDDILKERDELLEAGGFLYMRLDYDVHQDRSVKKQPVSNRNLLDIFLDSRPSERIRAYAQGRIIYTPTMVQGQDTQAQLAWLLDQMWLKFDIARIVYLTVGKQPLRWGSGYFWNPTDFMNSQVRDPLAVFDERTGVALVKFHLPIESLGWNFYAIGNVSGASAIEDISLGLRGEFVLGQTEIALSYAKGTGQPWQLGFDLSSGIGLFDLHAEIALQRGVTTPVYRGQLNLDVRDLRIPRQISRKNDWIVQGVMGAELGLRYTDDDTVYIGVEYFYNDMGYKDAQLYAWLLAQNSYRPLYVGRHYLSMYLQLPKPGSWNRTTLRLTAIGNLGDQSFMTRFDYNITVLTFLNVNVYGVVHMGNQGEFRFGIDPINALPQQNQPVMLPIDDATLKLAQKGRPTQIFEVGTSLRLTF